MEGQPGYYPMEAMMPEKTANFVAKLQIGKNEEGRVASPLQTGEELAQFGERLALFKKSLTITSTADCIDERRTISLADGTTNPQQLRNRIVYQWPGGLGLALAKAAVAADAAFIRDAKNFQQAYEISHDLLAGLRTPDGFAYEDAGHENCGASTLVETSVATPPPREILLPTTAAIIEINSDKEYQFDEVQANKKRKLEAGFYGSWSNTWHEDFLSQKVPHNFSKLATQPDKVHGHYGKGLYLINEEGQGFAKNEFIETTGEHAFAATVSIARDISHVAGGVEEERSKLLIGFIDDLIIVSDDLLATDFPAYSDAA